MRLIFVAISTIASSLVFAQDSLKENRVLVGINVSPDYCFRSLKNMDGSINSIYSIKDRDSREIAKLGYTAGVNICLNFSQHTCFETGIQYSNKGYQSTMQDLSAFYIDSTSPVRGKGISSFHYLDIPLKFNFNFGKSKLRFCGSIGVAANILLKQNVLATFEYESGITQQQKLTSTQYNKFNLSPLISAGVNYQIFNSMNLKIEPTFRYGVLKVVDSGVGTYLWNLGLNIGCYYAIK